MGNFEFLSSTSRYLGAKKHVTRLEKRHQFLVEPFTDDFRNGRVLDVAAHDGRWSYAFAQSGAASVLGVEARTELIDSFQSFPSGPTRDKVTLVAADLHEHLDALCASDQEFDFIVLFGIMYHVMDHFSILRKCLRLRPRKIVIDSEFMKGGNPFIQLVKEDPAKELNAFPQIPGQTMAIKGVLSSVAMERIAEALNCRIEWLPWHTLPRWRRAGVRDYFRAEEHAMIRRTCALTPH